MGEFSDAARKNVQETLRELFKTASRAAIVFSDAQGNTLFTFDLGPVAPGDTVTIPAVEDLIVTD